MSSHPIHVTHHLRFSKIFTIDWKTLVWVYKIQVFSLIQIVLKLDLRPVKDGPCRSLLGGNILRMLCQIELKIYGLLNFRVMNQNVMFKRDEYKWKLCHFDVLVRFRISENCQKWSITNQWLTQKDFHTGILASAQILAPKKWENIW